MGAASLRRYHTPTKSTGTVPTLPAGELADQAAKAKAEKINSAKLKTEQAAQKGKGTAAGNPSTYPVVRAASNLSTKAKASPKVGEGTRNPEQIGA